VRSSIKCLSRWLPIEGTVSLCTLKIESPPPKDMLPASVAMTSRKETSAPKKQYAMVRLWGRNDADERQQAKGVAEMRLQNKQRRFKPMKKSELRELYQMMFLEYPDIVTVKELREMLGISRKLAYKLIDYGYIHAVKIGTTLKIPKISVINYVMEKEVKKVG